MEILRRTKKAMIRAMGGVNLIEKRRSQERMSFLGLENTLDGLARSSGVRWYGHVLKRALGFEVAGRRGRRRPNMTWKRQMEEYGKWKNIDQIKPKEEVVRWSSQTFEKHEVNPSTCVNANKTRFQKWIFLSH